MALSPTSSRSSGSSTGGGGWTLIQEITRATNGVIDFTGIAGTYKHLMVLGMVRCANAQNTANAYLRFNADSGTNYMYQRFGGASTSAVAAVGSSVAQITAATIPGDNATASDFALLELVIPNYAVTAALKTVRVASNAFYAASANWESYVTLGRWNSTAAITQVNLSESSGSGFLTASRLSLFGLA